MTEDIIFLGAGASRADGAPLQSELFRDFFSFPGRRSWSADEIFHYDGLKIFFKDFFGIDISVGDISQINFPTFEEVMGIIEFALKKEEGFKNWYQDVNNSKLLSIKHDFIMLIARVLERKLRDKNIYHKKLVRRLVSDGRLSNTAFLSVNYEILIDNAILDIVSDHKIDYGFEPTIIEQPANIGNNYLAEQICLYKLHGSLNWLYCPTCIFIAVTQYRKSALDIDSRCGSCNSPLTPILIPPTFFKVMSNHYLDQIWCKTETLLKQARRIIFCGYSFPDADIHIKYLLKRAEVNSRPLEVIVVNSYPEKSEYEKKAEKNRYERFFSNKNKIHYTDISFEEFCEQGTRREAKAV